MCLVLLHFFKSLCDSFVGVAEAFFQTQNFLANYRESKVPGLDGACVNRANSNLMHAIAFHLDKRIGLGLQWILLLSIDVPSQRKDRLGPAAMTQPATLVRARCSQSQAGRTSRVPFATPMEIDPQDSDRSGELSPSISCSSTSHFAFWKKINGVDAEAAVAIAIIRTPESEKARRQTRVALRPSVATRTAPTFTELQARFDGSCFIDCSEEIKTHMHHPINRAAARYQAASAGGM